MLHRGSLGGTDALVGSTALVTGVTAGIGYAIALELARQGAEVVVHGRNAERGAKAVQQIENSGGKARFGMTFETDDADFAINGVVLPVDGGAVAIRPVA